MSAKGPITCHGALCVSRKKNTLGRSKVLALGWIKLSHPVVDNSAGHRRGQASSGRDCPIRRALFRRIQDSLYFVRGRNTTSIAVLAWGQSAHLRNHCAHALHL